MIKARVHLIISLPEHDPFSFRTDVLCLTRDPQWPYKQALDAAVRSLLAIGQPAHKAEVLTHSLEWVPSLNEARAEVQPVPPADATATRGAQ